jgi:hypothetical protein
MFVSNALLEFLFKVFWFRMLVSIESFFRMVPNDGQFRTFTNTCLRLNAIPI